MSAAKPIPEEYRFATPMLAVGDASGAIEFYKEAFGATEAARIEEPDGRISHSEVRIGDARIMVADEFPGENVIPETLGGSPVILNLFVEDVDALFSRATAVGAKVLRPLADQFTGNRNGKLEDPFGHVWLIQTHKEDVSDEEMRRRYEDLTKQQDGANVSTEEDV